MRPDGPAGGEVAPLHCEATTPFRLTMIALTPDTFIFLYAVCVLGPLVSLALLLLRRTAGKRWLLASGIVFLPAVLAGALMVFGSGTKPQLGMAGMGLAIVTWWVVAIGCFLSLVCGAFCFRTYPWSALWLVPAVVMLVPAVVTLVVMTKALL